MAKPTQEFLQERFIYDPETGSLIYRVNAGKFKAGDKAGTSSSHYEQVCINYRIYRLHIVAWCYMTGVWPEHQIDHKDRNKRNNRWSNLGRASFRGQQLNSDRVANAKGYWRDKRDGRYYASKIVLGKRISLGGYATPDEAHAAYAGVN